MGDGSCLESSRRSRDPLEVQLLLLPEKDSQMATVYKFDVTVVSAFCSYRAEYLQKEIEKLLKEWQDPDMKARRAGLEGIEVKLKA